MRAGGAESALIGLINYYLVTGSWVTGVKTSAKVVRLCLVLVNLHDCIISLYDFVLIIRSEFQEMEDPRPHLPGVKVSPSKPGGLLRMSRNSELLSALFSFVLFIYSVILCYYVYFAYSAAATVVAIGLIEYVCDILSV